MTLRDVQNFGKSLASVSVAYLLLPNDANAGVTYDVNSPGYFGS